ncbi:hypothetical protein L2E82_04095 [Cichorium intybus]|uniref:Uncharacterized protein n=1 Tax=Cichorium intybus TaxID=13427 RepID=A0ACB9H519_CICIN|nr:hypothetical protein L2E82_04095 [Cichorium intybus]
MHRVESKDHYLSYPPLFLKAIFFRTRRRRLCVCFNYLVPAQILRNLPLKRISPSISCLKIDFMIWSDLTSKSL